MCQLLTPCVDHTWSIWVLYRVYPMIFWDCLGLGNVCYLHLPTTYYHNQKHQHQTVHMGNHQWSTTTTSSAWFRIREGLHSNKPRHVLHPMFFRYVDWSWDIYPIGFMHIKHGIFTYIYQKQSPVHVGRYSIHGSYGYTSPKYQKCGAPWSLESRQLSLVVFSHMICKGNFYPPVN